MRLLALALIVVLVAPTHAGPRTGRAGKVVRVERPRTGARGTPRICQLREVGTGQCWGKPPVEGELGWVVDRQKNRGQVRIGKITANTNGCAAAQDWTFELDALNADLNDVEPYQTWVLLDVELLSTARVADSRAIKELEYQDAWLAVDRGHGSVADPDPDFVVMAYACTPDGEKIVNGYGNGGYCLDYYLKSGSLWSQVRRDIVASCRN